MTRLLVCLVLVAATPAAFADIAVLRNGTTFKVTSTRTEGGFTWLVLKDGGEIAIVAGDVQAVVSDEVVEEVVAEMAAAPPGQDIEALVVAAARRHGLDPALVRAVVAVESAFQPRAVSPKGAQGLMQLMPATARSLGVVDPFDAGQSLDGGTRHLKGLVERYGGNLGLALAAYNAGEGAVARHRGVPPYRETRDYVRRVLGRLKDTPSPSARHTKTTGASGP